MSKRILVVEDQPDNRQIIRDMLAPTDYEITEAENGEQALTAIAKQRPDLILSADDPLRVVEAPQPSLLAAGRDPTSSIRASICQRPLMRRCGRSPSTRGGKSMIYLWKASS